jgi:hypothetical protein
MRTERGQVSDFMFVSTLMSTLFLFFHIVSLPPHVLDICPKDNLRDINRFVAVDLLSGHNDVEIGYDVDTK